MTKDRLLFFGTDAFSLPALVRLIAEGWPIVAVVTKPDSRTGRGRALTPPAVKRLAEASHIPVLQPVKVSDIEPKLKSLEPSSGIVVAYGRLIPSTTLKFFPKGLINIHPSLLPAYRGPTPIESAILNGDKATGVTLMRLDHGMDTGPTYDQTKLQLAGTESRLDLYEHLSQLGTEFLSAKLSSILDGTIVPIPQNSTHASTTRLIRKADGQLDWTKPAVQLEREVRAYLGWPGSRTAIADVAITVTAAHVQPADGPAGTAYKTASSELAVYTGQGSLIIDRLKPTGKRDMTGPEFLAGHPLH
jgi:methionyl-tRNA formyltransferase